MGVEQVIPGIAAYLGGGYDPTFRRYTGNTPSPMIGCVRRAMPKQADAAEFFLAQPEGARTGAIVVVGCFRHIQERVTPGPSVAPGGGHLERIVYDVELACYLRSSASYAEDTQDDVWAVKSALLARLRADPTLGGVALISGEHDPGGDTTVDYGHIETTAGLSKTYFSISFGATEYLNV
jgi:hypothetical protein